MDFHITNDWRTKRNHLNHHLNSGLPPYGPMHYSIASYCTDALNKTNIVKSDLKEIITDEALMNLQQNLSETIPSPLLNKMSGTQQYHNFSINASEIRVPMSLQKADRARNEQPLPALTATIANFVTRMFNSVTGAMPFNFQRRAASPPIPAPAQFEYYDFSDTDQKDSGFDECDYTGGSPPLHTTNDILRNDTVDIENRVVIEKSSNNSSLPTVPTIKTNMNTSSEDVFEDAYSSEDTEQVDAIVSNNIPQPENVDVVKTPPEIEKTETNVNKNNVNIPLASQLAKFDIEKKCSYFMFIPIPNIDVCRTNMHFKHKRMHPKMATNAKMPCKKFKNHRQAGKRKNACIRQSIQDDLRFANDVDVVDSAAALEESPITETPHEKLTNSFGNYCCFDEVRGRFRSNSTTDSEDSFQIVFSDSPQQSPRTRYVSDCDSEDSFIIFEDNDADPCYTSTDVFGDDSSGIDESDESSDDEQDDLLQCACGNLSRTISDLTDESLYEDAMGSNGAACYGGCHRNQGWDSPSGADLGVKKLKLADVRLDGDCSTDSKRSTKKVRFSDAPPQVRVMRVWAYAARQARMGHWAQYGLDRARFKQRIEDVDTAISWVLTPKFRTRMKFQRFMPWWHAQRRQEEAEKKQKQEEDRSRKEEEERRHEEDEIMRKEEAERRRDEEEETIINETEETKINKEKENEREDYLPTEAAKDSGDMSDENGVKNAVETEINNESSVNKEIEDAKRSDVSKSIKPAVALNIKRKSLEKAPMKTELTEIIPNNIRNKPNVIQNKRNMIQNKPNIVTTTIITEEIVTKTLEVVTKIDDLVPMKPTNIAAVVKSTIKAETL